MYERYCELSSSISFVGIEILRYFEVKNRQYRRKISLILQILIILLDLNELPCDNVDLAGKVSVFAILLN